MAATDDQQPRALTTNLLPPIELVSLRNPSLLPVQHSELTDYDRYAAEQDHESTKSDEPTGQEDLETVPLRFVIWH